MYQKGFKFSAAVTSLGMHCTTYRISPRNVTNVLPGNTITDKAFAAI